MEPRPAWMSLLRWTSRALSLAAVAFVVIAFGIDVATSIGTGDYGGELLWHEIVGVLLVLLATVGLALSWRFPVTGGVVAFASVLALAAILAAATDADLPWFLVAFALLGVLAVLDGLLARSKLVAAEPREPRAPPAA